MKKNNKIKKSVSVLAFLFVCALSVILSSCSDELDIQQSYPFKVETMPVPKDISLIGRNSKVCHLYEGFMDFLSAVMLGIGRGEDCIVLNSVSNMQKVHRLLKDYGHVYCHLDNDEAGENACAELQKRYGEKVIDHSHLYTGYKDLNEYLTSHKTRK